MILLIDNYDSFTWNLVQRIGELDPSTDLRVERNDRVDVAEVERSAPSHIIISPGPGTPEDAGVSNDIVRAFAGRIPILGVCLGHQCIGFAHGMAVARHRRIMHGKTSEVSHDGRGVFEGLPNPFPATRYHSLVIPREAVPPAGWEVSAWTMDVLDDGAEHEVVMGLRRAWDDPAAAPLEGVQIHPESFLTDAGPQLIANFLNRAAGAGSPAAGATG